MPTRPYPPPTDARLRNVAMAYLARFTATTTQVTRVLDRRVQRYRHAHGQDLDDTDTFLSERRAVIDAIVRDLVALGLINDQETARTRWRAMRHKGMPAARVRARLAHDGVSTDVMDTCAHEDVDIDDHMAARRYAERRRLGPWRIRPSSDSRQHQKDMAALCRAGFSLATARAVLKE